MSARIPLSSGVFEPSSRKLLLPDGSIQSLTPKEAGVLAYLVENQERAVSREELLEQVWGYSAKVYSRTLEVTLHRLRAQIEREPSSPEHVRTIPGQGYRFFPKPAADAPLPQRVALFGRESALQAVNDLTSRHRVVTLAGIGGIGKTSLALEAIHNRPYTWVDLSEETDLPGVLRQFASALGLVGGFSVEEVGAALDHRGDLRLAIDNLEQVVMETTPVLRRWLDMAPHLRMLVTSRVSLGLREEAVFPVEPLSDRDAQALLLDRAQQRVQRWGADDPVVPELVKRLSGIPLALELAAARARLMSPSQLLARLSEGKELLSSSNSDRPERHHSLRRALEGSWELLSEEAQQCLLRLATFSGGFPLEAVERVVDLPDPESLLEELLEHSWVIGAPGGRFEFLVPVREFALEKQDEVVRSDARTAIGRWAASLVPDDLHERLHGRSGKKVLQELSLEIGNLRVARSCGDPEAAARAQAALLFLDVQERNGESPARALVKADLTDSTRRLLALGMIELGNFLDLDDIRAAAAPLILASDRMFVARSAFSHVFRSGRDFAALQKELSEGVDQSSLHEQLLMDLSKLGAYRHYSVTERIAIGENAVRIAEALGDHWCRTRAADLLESIRSMWSKPPEWIPGKSTFTGMHRPALLSCTTDAVFEEEVSRMDFSRLNPAESSLLRCRWAAMLLRRSDLYGAERVLGSRTPGRLGSWLWESTLHAQLAQLRGNSKPGDEWWEGWTSSAAGLWNRMLAGEAAIELCRLRGERECGRAILEELQRLVGAEDAEEGSSGAFALLRAQQRWEEWRG